MRGCGLAAAMEAALAFAFTDVAHGFIKDAVFGFVGVAFDGVHDQLQGAEADFVGVIALSLGGDEFAFEAGDGGASGEAGGGQFPEFVQAEVGKHLVGAMGFPGVEAIGDVFESLFGGMWHDVGLVLYWVRRGRYDYAVVEVLRKMGADISGIRAGDNCISGRDRCGVLC